MSRGGMVVWAIFGLVAFVTWREVGFEPVWFFAGVIVGAVGGVASVWVAQRFRVER
jgi:NO-binding membrane sensor protein with MHYT domain